MRPDCVSACIDLGARVGLDGQTDEDIVSNEAQNILTSLPETFVR